MIIKQTVEIPANHWLTLEIPPEIPAGRTILTFSPAPVLPGGNQEPVCAGEPDGSRRGGPAAAEPADITGTLRNDGERGHGSNGKQATPISDSLLGIASSAGDISLAELRAERLSKYLK
jgi:hypothetical protein